jgi:hypothetical protein
VGARCALAFLFCCSVALLIGAWLLKSSLSNGAVLLLCSGATVGFWGTIIAFDLASTVKSFRLPDAATLLKTVQERELRKQRSQEGQRREAEFKAQMVAHGYSFESHQWVFAEMLMAMRIVSGPSGSRGWRKPMTEAIKESTWRWNVVGAFTATFSQPHSPGGRRTTYSPCTWTTSGCSTAKTTPRRTNDSSC